MGTSHTPMLTLSLINNPDFSGWGMLLPIYPMYCFSVLIVFCCHCLELHSHLNNKETDIISLLLKFTMYRMLQMFKPEVCTTFFCCVALRRITLFSRSAPCSVCFINRKETGEKYKNPSEVHIPYVHVGKYKTQDSVLLK